MDTQKAAMTPDVVVVASGTPINRLTVPRLTDSALVIAANGGLDQAEQLGLPVDVVIGDMDSVSADALARAEASSTRIERHPVDKDATDLELALNEAARVAGRAVLVLGGHGGRMDHLLANALLLASATYAGMAIEWWSEDTRVAVARPGVPVTVSGRPGLTVSLLCAGSTAHGVTATGFRWPLDDDDLAPGSTRGVSNELFGGTATVSVRSGAVLVVHERVDDP